MSDIKKTKENLHTWNDDYSKSIRMNVGRAIRKRRLEIGLEAKQFASELGFSQEQLQKYEKGTNSLRIEKMWKFCELLRKPLLYFVEDVPSYNDELNTPDKRIRKLMHMFDALDDKGQMFIMGVCQNAFDHRRI